LLEGFERSTNWFVAQSNGGSSLGLGGLLG
jgi:hypothetical protein